MTIKKPSYKPFLLFQNQRIIYLHGQIAQQKQVLQTVQTLLPKQLAEQVDHCVLREQKLLVYTHSAVWASQLRFYHHEMLAAARLCTQLPITMVQVKIISQFIAKTRYLRKAQLPSAERIEQFQKDSTYVTDENLRSALLSLGETLARLSKQKTDN